MRDDGIGSWPTRRARMLAGKTALEEPTRSLTYGELDALCTAVAHGLRSKGIGRGDRVAFLGLNSIDLVVTMLATAKLAAVFVPLNTRLAADELTYILGDAEPSLLVHTADFTDALGKTDVPRLDLGPADGTVLATLGGDTTAIDEPVALDDLFMIQYTSGTSGRPKGVRLSHGNITWNVYNLLSDVDVCTDEVALVTAPLFHTAALNQILLPTLLKGGTSLVEARFDPERAVRLVEERGVTLLFGVTSMYLALAAVPAFPAADLSSLRSAMTGGSPVPETLLRTYADRGVRIIQGYGLTETSPGATLVRAEDSLRKQGTAGAGVFWTDVRIVDAAGEPVGVGEPGEAQVRGPNVTDGYWRNETATADAFTEDGWLRTGDLAEYDDDGFVRVVGRLKDMYISGGENVYPAEVEAALHTHPAVAECAVIGVPDERWGEVGRAVVVLRAPVTEADLLAHLQGRLARYKQPKSVVVVDELPHNASGKILKGPLRREFG